MFKSKKITKCKVKFDNDRIVFYPGEKMKGKFVLEMDRSMPMNNITAVCKGKTKTEWETTTRNSEGEDIITEYESKHKFFETKKKIYGDGDGDKKDHEAGQHEYPFEFEIPKDAPTSFQSSLGFIQYSLKIIIKKSWKKDLKLKKMFIVNEVIDANKESYNVAPGDEDQKMLGCLCCASGPITLSCHLNRSCFCPGENILVTAKLENNTERDMDELETELMQCVRYEAKNKDGFGTGDKVETKKIAELESKKIKGGDTLEWKSKVMPLPPMPPTMKSKYINISYYVKVHLEIPMAIDMDFKLPVTIGSVPFQPTYQEAGTTENKFKAKAPKDCGPPDVSYFGHPGMAPFQYSQDLKDKAKKMNKKDDKEFEDDTYIPVYTFAMPAQGKESSSRPTSSEGTKTEDQMPPIE